MVQLEYITTMYVHYLMFFSKYVSRDVRNAFHTYLWRLTFCIFAIFKDFWMDPGWIGCIVVGKLGMLTTWVHCRMPNESQYKTDRAE